MLVLGAVFVHYLGWIVGGVASMTLVADYIVGKMEVKCL